MTNVDINGNGICEVFDDALNENEIEECGVSESEVIESGIEGVRSSSGRAVDIRFWRVSGNSISVRSVLVNGNATNVQSWPPSIQRAVNGPFFSIHHPTHLSAFAMDRGEPVLPRSFNGNGRSDGFENFEDIVNRARPLDFMMDLTVRTANSLVVFGNGGSFPVRNNLNGQMVSAAAVRWGVGGYDLEMTRTALDNPNSSFSGNWRWGNATNPANVTGRTAIGYLGGSVANTEYIIAASLACTMFDIRMFMKNRGCSNFGLYLDGSASTQVRMSGGVLLRPPALRAIPAVVSW